MARQDCAPQVSSHLRAPAYVCLSHTVRHACSTAGQHAKGSRMLALALALAHIHIQTSHSIWLFIYQ